MLEKAETKKGKSEKKEESLAADESKVDKQISATENLLKEGAMHPSKKKLLREICRKLKLLVLM